MYLSEVINSLSNSEFSQLALGGKSFEDLSEVQLTQYTDHVNMGLMALYKRFNLKQGELEINVTENVRVYPITDRSFLKVEEVFDDMGVELVLNDESNTDSVLTPNTRTIKLPLTLVTTKVKLVGRAAHPKLDPEDVLGLGADVIELELPDAYLWALSLFVASRVHNPIGMGQEFNSGNTYYQKYEMECQRLENEGLAVDRVPSNNRLARGGWV